MKLLLDSPYAGPLKLENTEDRRRSLINGRQAHIWVWATGRFDLKSVTFRVSISGKQALSQPISPARTKGEPVYATHAIETSAHYEGDLTVDDLRAAIGGPVSLPLVKLDDLEIVATFDAMGAQVSGTVLNTSNKALSNVGLVYKVMGTDLFGVTIVRVGDIAPGKAVPFKQSLARIQERHSLPVIAIEFDSLYDESKPLSVSPD